MADIWFTSDTHFGHANILKFEHNGERLRKEFYSCVEMDEAMIANWNNVVKPQDKVYHCGDVTFRYDGYFNNIMSRLNGHKRLIVGNHDKLTNPNLFRWFEKVQLWSTSFIKEGFIVTHVPLREDQFRKAKVNVHGHVHRNTIADPRYYNVCVEVCNYTPKHRDEFISQ